MQADGIGPRWHFLGQDKG